MMLDSKQKGKKLMDFDVFIYCLLFVFFAVNASQPPQRQWISTRQPDRTRPAGRSGLNVIRGCFVVR